MSCQCEEHLDQHMAQQGECGEGLIERGIVARAARRAAIRRRGRQARAPWRSTQSSLPLAPAPLPPFLTPFRQTQDAVLITLAPQEEWTSALTEIADRRLQQAGAANCQRRRVCVCRSMRARGRRIVQHMCSMHTNDHALPLMCPERRQ